MLRAFVTDKFTPRADVAVSIVTAMELRFDLATNPSTRARERSHGPKRRLDQRVACIGEGESLSRYITAWDEGRGSEKRGVERASCPTQANALSYGGEHKTPTGFHQPGSAPAFGAVAT